MPELIINEWNPRPQVRNEVSKLTRDMQANFKNRSVETAIYLGVRPSSVDKSSYSFDLDNVQTLVFKNDFAGQMLSGASAEDRDLHPILINGGHRRASAIELHHTILASIHDMETLLGKIGTKAGNTKEASDARTNLFQLKQKAAKVTFMAKVFDLDAIESDPLSHQIKLLLSANARDYVVAETDDNTLLMFLDHLNTASEVTDEIVEKTLLTLLGQDKRQAVFKANLGELELANTYRRLVRNPLFRYPLPFTMHSLTQCRIALTFLSIPLMRFMGFQFEVLTSQNALLLDWPAYKGATAEQRAKVESAFVSFFHSQDSTTNCRFDILTHEFLDALSPHERGLMSHKLDFGFVVGHQKEEQTDSWESIFTNIYLPDTLRVVKDFVAKRAVHFAGDTDALRLLNSMTNRFQWMIAGQLGAGRVRPAWATKMPLIVPETIVDITHQVVPFKHLYTQILAQFEPLAYFHTNRVDRINVGSETIYSLIWRCVKRDNPVASTHYAQVMGIVALLFSHRATALPTLMDIHRTSAGLPTFTNVYHYHSFHKDSKDASFIETVDNVVKYLKAYIDGNVRGVDKARLGNPDHGERLSIELMEALLDAVTTSIDPLILIGSKTTHTWVKLGKYVVLALQSAYATGIDQQFEGQGHDKAALSNPFIRRMVEDIGLETWYTLYPLPQNVEDGDIQIKMESDTHMYTALQGYESIASSSSTLLDGIRRLFHASPLTHCLTLIDEDEDISVRVLKPQIHKLLQKIEKAVTEEAYNSAKQFETVYEYHNELDILAKDQITSRIVYPSKSVHHTASIEDLRTWHSPANMRTLINSSTARDPTLARHAGFRKARARQMQKREKGKGIGRVDKSRKVYPSKAIIKDSDEDLPPIRVNKGKQRAVPEDDVIGTVDKSRNVYHSKAIIQDSDE
ncbi:hypothetical protein C0991_002599, partial [Blastosporella zonata]